MGHPATWTDPKGVQRVVYYNPPDPTYGDVSDRHAARLHQIAPNVAAHVFDEYRYFRTGSAGAWARSVAPPLGATDGMTVTVNHDTNAVIAIRTGPMGPHPLDVNIAPLNARAAKPRPLDVEQVSIDVTDTYYFGPSGRLQVYVRDVLAGSSACGDSIGYQLIVEQVFGGLYRHWKVVDGSTKGPLKPSTSSFGFSCQEEFPLVDVPSAWPLWVDSADLPVAADFPRKTPPKPPELGRPWSAMDLPINGGDIVLSTEAALVVRYPGAKAIEVWSSSWAPVLQKRAGWEKGYETAPDPETGAVSVQYHSASGESLALTMFDAEGAGWIAADWF